MSIVSRRTFTKGLLASALVPGHSAIGQPNDPGSIAIIDTPHNAAKVASKLAAQNVKVVVRFFARKPQPGLREKIMASDGNMIDGVREPTISDQKRPFDRFSLPVSKQSSREIS